MKKPNLKNYTTNILAEKSIMEIEQLLSGFGATAILKDYAGDGGVKALSFKLMTEHGEMPFKLPMNERQVAEYRAEQVIDSYAKDRRRQDLVTARNIGWRIMKDWLHSQLSIVFLKMAKPQEVLLPYLYDPIKKQTLYEKIEQNKFSTLLLEEKQ